jgi:hypothetical protein
MKQKPQFTEGPKAREKFERAMKSLFKAPKHPKSKPKKKGKDLGRFTMASALPLTGVLSRFLCL